MYTLHEEMALRAHGGVSKAIPYAPHGFALINALVLGKVALIVEELRLGQRWRPEPLIFPIVLEPMILAVLFIAMHMLEGVIGGWLHGEALAKSVPMIGGGGILGVAFGTFGFFVAMLPFCGFRQLTMQSAGRGCARSCSDVPRLDPRRTAERDGGGRSAP